MRTTHPTPTPTVFVPMKTWAQGELPGISEEETEESLYQFECSLSDALSDTAHSYGLQIRNLEVIYYGSNVYAKFFFDAPSYCGAITFGASRLEHPVRSLCSKFLRWCRAHHEQLE